VDPAAKHVMQFLGYALIYRQRGSFGRSSRRRRGDCGSGELWRRDGRRGDRRRRDSARRGGWVRGSRGGSSRRRRRRVEPVGSIDGGRAISEIVGGGRFAGSGIGTAAEISSSVSGADWSGSVNPAATKAIAVVASQSSKRILRMAILAPHRSRKIFSF